ncbi:unnamed protein product [Alternaria alternata]
MVLNFIRQLYSLDTLDTRFVVPATAPPKEALEEAKLDPAGPVPAKDGRDGSKNPENRSHPPLWNTPEFYFYYVVILTSVFFMFKLVLDVSQESHPNYPKFDHLLSDGWIPGRKVDNTDAQYGGFRQNIPYLFIVVVLHPILRKAYDSFWRADTYTQVRSSSAIGGLTMGLTPSAAADARMNQRVSFDLLFAAVFLAALHGFSAFKILAILYANYCIGTKLPRQYVPAATWIFNFDMANNIKKKQLDPSNLSERDRVTIPAKPTDYTFRNYFAYAMYSPLYLAGPIITFNDYIAQCRYKPHSITTKRTTLYLVRFIVVLLTMEIMIHYMYMVAIFHARPDWSQYTPAQLSMLGFFNLKHIWLKLLIPWRFFRLWSLMDGIDPPENMVRCMSDNYSVMYFWRGWHRSFNKWSLRYLYIPLGGNRGEGMWGKARSIGNYLAVFTFIAIWHDIQLRLLMWGWLVTLFVLPEIIASYIFPARKWKNSPDAYRWLCGVGAVFEILMLMTANLVGFALGVDGLKDLVRGIVGTWSGWMFLATACGALFTGVQFMFEWREREKRRGIKMKC